MADFFLVFSIIPMQAAPGCGCLQIILAEPGGFDDLARIPVSRCCPGRSHVSVQCCEALQQSACSTLPEIPQNREVTYRAGPTPTSGPRRTCKFFVPHVTGISSFSASPAEPSNIRSTGRITKTGGLMLPDDKVYVPLSLDGLLTWLADSEA
jgi:hypothetical protein